jgi:hypothetical protein
MNFPNRRGYKQADARARASMRSIFWCAHLAALLLPYALAATGAQARDSRAKARI